MAEEVASEEVASEEAEEEEAAPASPEEEAIAKLRRKLYMSPGDWYVIHTYSGHERKVKANLEQRITTQNMEDYIFAVEVPDEYVMEYRGTTKKRVRHVRIPGYAIVCMDFNEASYRVVKETPAVTGFRGRPAQPRAALDRRGCHAPDPQRPRGSRRAPRTSPRPFRPSRPSSRSARSSPSPTVPSRLCRHDLPRSMPETQKLKVLVTIFERETPLDARLRPGGEARAVMSPTRTWGQARVGVIMHICVRWVHCAR